MKVLNKNWLTEHIIDFEYKKYILLAYLKEVSTQFDEQKIYPFLADLIEHYKQLVMLKNDTNKIFNQFPTRLIGFDVERFNALYENVYPNDNIIRELEEIINFSIPEIEFYLKEGKKIYDMVESSLTVYPVGVSPLYSNEGYMILNDGKALETKVFEYQITIFNSPDAEFRGIHTTYIASYIRNLSNTSEYIKSDLIRTHRKLPNPAAYAFETDLKIPFEETYLPIAKRILVKYVSVKESG